MLLPFLAGTGFQGIEEELFPNNDVLTTGWTRSGGPAAYYTKINDWIDTADYVNSAFLTSGAPLSECEYDLQNPSGPVNPNGIHTLSVNWAEIDPD